MSGDIMCRQCGEPWDLDSIHDFIAENHDRSEWLTNGKYDQTKYDVFFNAAMRRFRQEGCRMFDTSHGDLLDDGAVAILTVIDDAMGDDVDGAISMQEDAQVIGLFD